MYRNFYNVSHHYDPVARICEFGGTPAASWIASAIAQSLFHPITTEMLIHTLNPHDLHGYIIDPAVSYRFLEAIMPVGTFNVSHTEAGNAHAQITDRMQDAQSIVHFASQTNSLSDFVDLVKMVRDFIKLAKTDDHA